jgi:hypothetical protein
LTSTNQSTQFLNPKEYDSLQSNVWSLLRIRESTDQMPFHIIDYLTVQAAISSFSILINHYDSLPLSRQFWVFLVSLGTALTFLQFFKRIFGVYVK